MQWLGVKRDDLLDTLHGGSKPRKLDFLLASEPYASAGRIASMGAIGSGHLTAMVSACGKLGRDFDAHVFWEPPSKGVLENLAFTASGANRLSYYRSRVWLGLTAPRLVVSKRFGDAAVVPPGGTTPIAAVGLVRAGLELAMQVQSGALPAPERIYVALGTGGTVAGLALGLGLGGLDCSVHAVATVERIFISAGKLSALIRSTAELLRARGFSAADPSRAVRIVVDHSQLGPGYGIATAQSLAACEQMPQGGPELEAVYTGKAFAALLADLSSSRGALKRVLFWHTARRGPLPAAEDWRTRLPPALAARLERSSSRPRLGRRLVLAAGVASAAGLGLRLSGYPSLPAWRGQVLSEREAFVLAAAAEAVLGPLGGPTPLIVAANVDRYLSGMPDALQTEVHQLLVLVEHGTGLGLFASRLTKLPVEAREAFLSSLSTRGGLLAQAWRGLKDLVYLGYYQDPSTWRALGYPGPKGEIATPELAAPDYESFRAGLGVIPKSARRQP